MKSFRFYLRHPIITPSRLVTDYSADEVADFRRGFKLVAEKYRFKTRLSVGGFLAALFFTFCGLWLPYPFWIYSLIAILCSLVVTAFGASEFPVCPGCENTLDAGIGAYCPECGSHEVRPRCWLRSPSCNSCGKELLRAKGSWYKIRGCTHCGLMLDSRGL